MEAEDGTVHMTRPETFRDMDVDGAAPPREEDAQMIAEAEARELAQGWHLGLPSPAPAETVPDPALIDPLQLFDPWNVDLGKAWQSLHGTRTPSKEEWAQFLQDVKNMQVPMTPPRPRKRDETVELTPKIAKAKAVQPWPMSPCHVSLPDPLSDLPPPRNPSQPTNSDVLAAIRDQTNTFRTMIQTYATRVDAHLANHDERLHHQEDTVAGILVHQAQTEATLTRHQNEIDEIRALARSGHSQPGTSSQSSAWPPWSQRKLVAVIGFPEDTAQAAIIEGMSALAGKYNCATKVVKMFAMGRRASTGRMEFATAADAHAFAASRPQIVHGTTTLWATIARSPEESKEAKPLMAIVKEVKAKLPAATLEWNYKHGKIWVDSKRLTSKTAGTLIVHEDVAQQLGLNAQELRAAAAAATLL